MELVVNQPSMTRQESPASSYQTVVIRMDRPLLVTVVVLIVCGLVSVYSASAYEAQLETGNSFSIFIRQLVFALVGLGGMWLISRVGFHFWRQMAKPVGLLSIALLLATLAFGITSHGSERWLPLPFGFQFQPSDVAKLAVVALMAQATSKNKLITPTLMLNLLMSGFMILLIFQQPNLSVSLIISMVTALMLLLGGLPWTVYVAGIPIVAYFVYHKVMDTEYQRRRITGWLDPWSDPQDTGYNLIQSYYALGSGGLFGVGFGHSIQKRYYLPFPYTDFIFSVIAEEWGVIGALILILLFAVFAWRGFRIALNCPNTFGQMLAFGITAMITLQAVINISVTIGMMPVTGVTLPFISYGGTSLVMTLLMVGILLNISRYRRVARYNPEAA